MTFGFLYVGFLSPLVLFRDFASHYYGDLAEPRPGGSVVSVSDL